MLSRVERDCCSEISPVLTSVEVDWVLLSSEDIGGVEGGGADGGMITGDAVIIILKVYVALIRPSLRVTLIACVPTCEFNLGFIE